VNSTVRISTGDDPRDGFYIRLCLLEAMRGLGWTSPNPLVGCVIARDGAVIARAAHLEDGLAHAERSAFLMLSSAEDAAAGRITPGCASGATLYVNLEPCSHHGRTPPCTDAIIGAGIARVVYGDCDSDPRSAGRARAVLENAGVAVTSGVCEDECRRFNERFHHRHTHKRAFVAVKIAQSLDGKIALADGASKWITCAESRARVQMLRQAYDAVLIGAGTLRADDARLTVRRDELAQDGIELARPRDPVAIVVTKSGVLPQDARLFKESRATRGETAVIVAAPKNVDVSGIPANAVVLRVPDATNGGIEWSALLERLPDFGVYSVLVEGGAGVWTSLIREGATARNANPHDAGGSSDKRDAGGSRDSRSAIDVFPDKYYIFVALKLIGGDGKSAIHNLRLNSLEHTPTIHDASFEPIGSDLLITGYGATIAR
jgi:diaminohydroxyphosphoribosylaminopyrimidine deaminase/5-amino-6-(5-phosphoribosylamino)uracil reductase